MKTIDKLVEDILQHKKDYYQGKPTISDAKYDALEDQLKKIAPDHPVLSIVGAEDLQGTSTSEKSTHASPMLSLQKTYETKDLLSWKKDYNVLCSYKIDGVSLSLTYKAGKLAIAKTRGNGKVGEVVTDKIQWCPEIPLTLKQKVDCEIRGELYCAESKFFQLSDTMQQLGLEKPTSPRNIVAGVLGRKTHGNLTRYFSFFAFDVITEDAQITVEHENDKQKLIKGMGFQTAFTKLIKTEKQLLDYIATAQKELENLDFGIDGIVLTYDDLKLHKELGSTAHHPRFKMVFKWAGETAESDIESLKWATSRFGIVTPVAVIKPVFLSGAEITNISLHNAAYVQNFNLKAGDRIELIRSGEVIPKFLRVIKSAPGEYQWPTRCDSCQSELVFDDVRLTCPNRENCPAQKIGGILNWIRAAEIDDLSEKRLQQMIDADLVTSIPDLYKLTTEQLLTLPQTKEKLAQKLWDNIQKSKNIQLENFLSGLGIAGMASTSWLKILEHHNTLDSLWTLPEDDLVTIDGFAEKTAQQVVTGLKRTKPLAQQLLKLGVLPKSPEKQSLDHPLAGAAIAITGTMSRPRAEIEKAIKEVGAKPSSSVSKKTTAVVAANPESNSSKLKKAKELGVAIWSENELFEHLQKSEKP